MFKAQWEEFFYAVTSTFFAIAEPSSWSKRNIVHSERHFSNTKRSLCRHHPHPHCPAV